MNDYTTQLKAGQPMYMHKEDRITQVTLVWSHPMFLQYLNLGTELGFEVERDKYNFLERGKYNFLWTYFLKS